MKRVLQTIISEFVFDDQCNIKQIYHNAWDINNEYVLKKSDNKAGIAKSIELCEKLLKKNTPVVEYMKTMTGETYVSDGDDCYCLMRKMKGEHLDPYKGNCSENGQLLGGIVADLHLALQHITLKAEVYDSDYMKELTDWITPEVEQKHINFLDGIMDACFDFYEIYKALPRQLIHRDMHLGNLLFNEGKFSGYLDFDISQINVRLLDICYLGASMLVGNYRNENRLRLWRELFSGVLTGYEQKSPLTENEKKAIPMMFVLIEVIFTVFFSKAGHAETAQNCADMTNWLYENMVFEDMLQL
ncbi:MAG TPA: hypothetical protein DDZ89_19985, partial [Clostridiales bacterium]|nr:hypothetical protein [Clostridiales bacterium]